MGRAVDSPRGQAEPAPGLADVALRCKRLVTQRAMVAAGAAALPIPGLDIVADVALLTKLLDRINGEFGLSVAQIEALQSPKRLATYKAIGWVGNQLIGQVVTKTLVLHVLKTVGVKVTAKQITKYVPLAGQAVSAVLAFAAMRHVCHQHIADCVKVRQQLALPSPAP
jgi:uncharacterized protein (DUF697 family)